MQTIKALILLVSISCLPLGAKAMDSGMSDSAGKFGSALEVVKKNPGVVLAAGLAMSAGVFLYRTVKGTSPVVKNIKLEQVAVLNQFESPEHGGSASCGYQALKNVLLMAKFGMPYTIEDDVRDVTHVQQLFGKNEPKGLWRKLIIENSYKRAIKWMLDRQLYSVLVPYKQLPEIQIPVEVQRIAHKDQMRFKEKIRGYYQGILGDELSSQTVADVMHALQDATPYTKRSLALAKVDLPAIIKKSNRTMDRDIDDLKLFDFEAYAKNDEVINSYLPSILDGNTLMWTITKKSALDAYNQAFPESGFDAQGDWIKEDEIALLIESEKKPHRLFADMPDYFDGITVIDNVLLLNKGEGSHKEISEIADRLAERVNFAHGFTVGLMNGEPGKETGERHWIALVVHKKDGDITWRVADSGGNYSRLKDSIVWTLIKHLMKKA